MGFGVGCNTSCRSRPGSAVPEERASLPAVNGGQCSYKANVGKIPVSDKDLHCYLRSCLI